MKKAKAKPATIQEKIGKQLDQMAVARRRSGLLRETSLLKFRWVPNIHRILEHVAEALLQGAGAQPLDPKRLGESVRRAKLRAVGRELRHLQEFTEEAATEPQPATSGDDPADRRLAEWAAEQRREIMRLALRFERRVGPAPETDA